MINWPASTDNYPLEAEQFPFSYSFVHFSVIRIKLKRRSVVKMLKLK